MAKTNQALATETQIYTKIGTEKVSHDKHNPQLNKPDGTNADPSSAVGTAGLNKPRITERTFPKNRTYFTFNINISS